MDLHIPDRENVGLNLGFLKVPAVVPFRLGEWHAVSVDSTNGFEIRDGVVVGAEANNLS